jgi:hypothetical protein
MRGRAGEIVGCDEIVVTRDAVLRRGWRDGSTLEPARSLTIPLSCHRARLSRPFSWVIPGRSHGFVGPNSPIVVTPIGLVNMVRKLTGW